ncbi:MAG: hypothetical protein JRJ60_13045, partial [Deltaproteobacteria bacterium]|nr:hypothetical protein [Deltaproteobacteria bacterium]
MKTDAFDSPIDQRYFEDYAEGAVHEFGSLKVRQDDIIASLIMLCSKKRGR